MSSQLGVNSVYLMPGMSIKIAAEISYKNSNGFAARTDAVPVSYFPKRQAAGETAPVELIDGFAVEDPSVGELTIFNENSLSVQYIHRKPATNAIWFFAEEDQTAILNVISVPIHDHSTIVHGGPAYGTYFDDDTER